MRRLLTLEDLLEPHLVEVDGWSGLRGDDKPIGSMTRRVLVLHKDNVRLEVPDPFFGRRGVVASETKSLAKMLDEREPETRTLLVALTEISGSRSKLLADLILSVSAHPRGGHVVKVIKDKFQNLGTDRLIGVPPRTSPPGRGGALADALRRPGGRRAG